MTHMRAAVIYENGDPGMLRYEDVAHKLSTQLVLALTATVSALARTGVAKSLTL
jgi:hypothetical protein